MRSDRRQPALAVVATAAAAVLMVIPISTAGAADYPPDPTPTQTASPITPVPVTTSATPKPTTPPPSPTPTSSPSPIRTPSPTPTSASPTPARTSATASPSVATASPTEATAAAIASPSPTPIVELLTETLKITIPQPTSSPIIIEIPLPVQVPIPASLPPIAADGSLPPAIPPVVFPVPIPLGQSIVLVNNEPVPVTITAIEDPATGVGVVSVQGAGFSLNLAVAGPDGTPVPLGANGQLQLVVGGAAALQGTGFRPNRVIDVYLILPPGTSPTGSPSATPAVAGGGPRFVQAGSIVRTAIAQGEAMLIGRVPVGPDGSFAGAVPLPADLPPGDYTLQARGAAKGKGLKVRTISMGVTVEAPSATATATPSASAESPTASASASASAGATAGVTTCSECWCLETDWLSWLIIGALLLLLIVLWIIGLASRRTNRAGVVSRDPLLAIVLGLTTLAGVVAAALGVLCVTTMLVTTIVLAVLAVIAGIVMSVRITR